MNPEDFFVARSRTSTNLRERAMALAATELPVLIVGPDGSGRRRLAELMHRQSRRHDRPFQKLDCPALTDADWFPRLFGRTGTQEMDERAGLLERVGNGTLVLVGLHAGPLALVNALRNLLDCDPCSPVYDNGRQVLLRCRLLATAIPGEHLDSLRSLFPRELELRPLAQRPEDIPALIDHFLSQLAEELGKQLAPPDEGLMERLSQVPWSNGEVQQLRRALRCAVQEATDDTFRESLLPDWVLTKLAGPALPVNIPEDNLALSSSDRLAGLIRDITLGLLDLKDDFAPPAFALRCRREDFQCPVIREIIRGTLEACSRFLARNVRDVKAGARPILGQLPSPPDEGEPQDDEDDLVKYFRAALEQRIRQIRELPDDTEDDLVVEIADTEPEHDQKEVASQTDIEAGYDKIVDLCVRLGKKIPGRDRMVEILEKNLLRKVPPTYVSAVRKKRGDDRDGGKSPKAGARLDVNIALDREGKERYDRDRRAGSDAQSQIDRRLDRRSKLERMDDGERAFEAKQLHIQLDAAADTVEQVELLMSATEIRHYVDHCEADQLTNTAESLGISAVHTRLDELKDQVFDRLWQQHLASQSPSNDA